MIGGLTDSKPITQEVEEIVNSIKNKFEKLNYNTDKFSSIVYKSQVVNGTNYFVKVETDKEFIHLRIHQALPHNNSTITFVSQQSNKKEDEEITYF
tara:strand:+ start:426 stop:713 length:288 start_codon:yes stop_codon:yes gene_type:complete